MDSNSKCWSMGWSIYRQPYDTETLYPSNQGRQQIYNDDYNRKRGDENGEEDGTRTDAAAAAECETSNDDQDWQPVNRKRKGQQRPQPGFRPNNPSRGP